MMLLNRMIFPFLICALATLDSSLWADTTPTSLEGAFTVPEGLTVEKVAGSELSAYPMFINFDDAGHLFVCESTGKDLSGKEMAAAPECLILRLVDENGDGVYDTKTVYADTLSLPMGMLWHNGNLFVTSPPEFLRFRDADGDGVAEEREVLLSGWNVLNTASLHGPFLGPDGWLYLTHGRHGYSIDTKEGTHLEGLAARIWRCRPDGTGLERFAGGGFDNPVELVFTPAGETLGTMTYFTDPRLGQRDALMHWVEGGVYPKMHECVDEFVRTGDLMPVMTKFSRIAPAGLVQLKSAQLGAEYIGNLFSAQFNPHRIQRHILERDGATYRTMDSDFLTCSYDYFYPTDLLEDADGSLLFCDTGAWYVDACPISRVSMPEIKGGIYRIKKMDHPSVKDAWGKEIKTDELSNSALVALLKNGRVKVGERALDAMVLRRKNIVPEIAEAYSHGASSDERNAYVRALWRIGGEESLQVLRKAINDADLDTRLLAISAVGALKDQTSVATLIPMLKEGSAPVIREAALALGKIGDVSYVPVLLEACAHPADRFVDHALILALIRLGDAEKLRTALMHDEAGIRKAALIALDQMDEKQLNAKDALPFFFDDDAENRRMGLWVASRHPDWAQDIATTIEKELKPKNYAIEKHDSLKSILLAYAANEKIQRILTEALSENPESGIPALALEVMEAAALAEFPKAWLGALKPLLKDPKSELVWPVLSLVRARNLDAFDDELLDITGDEKSDKTLRLNALATVIGRKKKLEEKQFDFVVGVMSNEDDPILRQNAVKVFAQAELSLEEKKKITLKVSAFGDALLLPSLLNLYKDESDESLGRALLNTLGESPQALARVKAQDFDQVFAHYPESVRNVAATLRPEENAIPIEVMEKFTRLREQKEQGDVGRGRRVFFSEKAACHTCHTVGEEGGSLGPDLTAIGAVRNRDDILEAVFFPSANILQDYPSVTIELEWETYSGIVAEESVDTVVLRAGADQTLRIPREEIKSISPSDKSIMPESLDSALSEEELLDLIAFLMSLNNEQWLLPGHHEGKEH